MGPPFVESVRQYWPERKYQSLSLRAAASWRVESVDF